MRYRAGGVLVSFGAKGLGKIFRACMLSLGNVVYYRSLLELVGRGGRGVGECGIGLAVCAWILWDKGAGDGETLGERME